MKNNVIYVDFVLKRKVITSEKSKLSIFEKLYIKFKNAFSGKTYSKKYVSNVYKINNIL